MNAVVIGGSSGIGKAVCSLLKEKEYTVWNLSRSINSDEGIRNLTLDVSHPGEVERVLAGIEPIDVLVYSAGFSMAAPIEYSFDYDVRYLYEVNFFGLLDTIRYCARVMREQGGGRIVAVSSLGGVMPIVFDSFYSSSKAAVDMLIRGANIELNPYNIYLTSVRPGATDTRFTFKRKIYPEDEVGVYGEKMHKAAVVLADMEQRGMAPEAVAECIMHVLESKKPPACVSAGIVNKGLRLIDKLLPSAAFDFLNKTFYLQ